MDAERVANAMMEAFLPTSKGDHMTPTERAEKIALNIHKLQHPGTFHVDWNENGRMVIDHIAVELETYASERVTEAVEEAWKDDFRPMLILEQEKIKAETYEDAAEIAKDFLCECEHPDCKDSDYIAKQIQAKATYEKVRNSNP